jgi:hypothetical protein
VRPEHVRNRQVTDVVGDSAAFGSALLCAPAGLRDGDTSSRRRQRGPASRI